MFLIREALFLVRTAPFLIGNMGFLVRTAGFLMRIDAFLIRNVLFPHGKSSVRAGRPWRLVQSIQGRLEAGQIRAGFLEWKPRSLDDFACHKTIQLRLLAFKKFHGFSMIRHGR